MKYKIITFDYPVVSVEHVFMDTGDVYKTELIGGIEMVKVPLSVSWLNEDDFKGETIIKGNVFIDEGKVELAKDNKFGRDKFTIGVRLATGEIRNVNINNTSRNLLVAQYGDDSSLWVGKKCILQGQAELVAKKYMFVIYVRPEV